MLAPALLYKEELIRKFTEHLYTQDYFYYNGYPCGTSLPTFPENENTYHYAILDQSKNLIGYFSYQIYLLTDSICNLGLYSFDKGNPIVGLSVIRKLNELLEYHHRLEWRVISSNPIKRHYDKFCKQHNGYISHLHDCTKDEQGNLLDEYIYEIIRKE